MAGCEEYVGLRLPNGYGILPSSERVDGERYAHRAAWIAAHGPILHGLEVAHSCDNPPCRKIEHLFLATHLENMQDMVTKGRHPSQVNPTLRHGVRSNNKLTPTLVREIRSRYDSESVSQRSLAVEYGVSQRTIWKVVNGYGWASVDNVRERSIR